MSSELLQSATPSVMIVYNDALRGCKRMKDPYQSGMFNSNPYHAKTDIIGSLNVVLSGKLENRELSLIKQISRCVLTHEIHELILSDEDGIGPGSTVNKIAYLGFTEIKQGGVLTTGDSVYCAGKLVGTLAGFDETHMPNHLNIVIKSDTRMSGAEQNVSLGDEVVFKHSK